MSSPDAHPVLTLFEDKAAAWPAKYGPDGPLARSLPDFRVRREQPAAA